MKHIIIDCSFVRLPRIHSPQQAIRLFAPAFGYARYLREKMDMVIIEQINYEGEVSCDHVRYHFFKCKKKFLNISFPMLRFIKGNHPNIILIQGLIFPVEIIFLRLMLNRQIIFIAQHHGCLPHNGIKKALQKIADRCIQTYLFTSLDNAKSWVDQHVISGYHKCYEVLEASTHFKRQDKAQSKLHAGITGNYNFLWVGRLNENKDPVTILAAFEDYLLTNPDAKLYMIYQEEDLLSDINVLLETNCLLHRAVFLVGKLPHEDLLYWYNAADFYISGSHHEGSGFALLEAMACGCIPVVTNIPSFRKITSNGKYGFLFDPGNVNELLQILQSLHSIDRSGLSGAILEYFTKELSFRSISDRLYTIFENLLSK